MTDGVLAQAEEVAMSPAMAEGEREFLAPLYPLPRVAIASGKGARVWDAEGREYLDFVSGIAVNALGHAPVGLARAVSRQMKTLGHVSNLFSNEPAAELAKALVAATGYERVFFCNSGSEGVEAALKFARAHARAQGRTATDFVAFEGGFHGRTGFAVSVTWQPSYRAPFEPLVPGVRFAPYNDVRALDGVLDEKVAAVIVEPVQGEGGAIPARREFLQALRKRTAALGIPLVLDEVQSGMGRTGRLLAAEHIGIQGDITVLSKALGGGIPVAAVLLTESVAASLSPGMHGCTFGGNPVSAAAGLWMLGQINRPGFLGKVRKRGRELNAALVALAVRQEAVREARGLGLLAAIELTKESGLEPRAVLAAAREEGLLVGRGGERAIRLLPPLNVAPEEIAEAVQKLEAALHRAALTRTQASQEKTT